MYAFEVGKTYGNWVSGLKRTVIARTKCYITLDGGITKRIRYRKIDDKETEYIPSQFEDLRIYAMAQY